MPAARTLHCRGLVACSRGLVAVGLHTVADREVDEALARSFLAGLPAEVVASLRAEGERADYPAGTMAYRPASAPQAALVLRGLLPVYLASVRARQDTVRYPPAGDRLG